MGYLIILIGNGRGVYISAVCSNQRVYNSYMLFLLSYAYSVNMLEQIVVDWTSGECV